MAFDSSFYADWQTLSIGAAAISVVASVMLIMLSRLFDLRHLEQIAKTEFVFAVSTVLIVMMTIGLVQYGEHLLVGEGGNQGVLRAMFLSSFQCPIESQVSFPGQTTVIDWMKLYMETSATCVQGFMNSLYSVSIPIEACTSIYMEIFMSEHASGFGCKWIAERITNTAQSLTFYMYVYFLLVHILNFVKYYAGFFFSVGVVMRAFPPTRGSGAYLMALAVGLYFVFPLFYVLIAEMSLPHAQADVITSTCGAAPAGGIAYTCMMPQVPDAHEYQCDGANTGNVFSIPDRIRSTLNLINDLLSVRLLSLGQHLTAAICLFPFVAFVILLTFVLNTTNLFGGNIPEIGRGLVKLI